MQAVRLLRAGLVVGGVLLLGGLGWAFGSRDDLSIVGPATVLVVAAVLAVACGAALAVRTARGSGLAGRPSGGPLLPEVTLPAVCLGAGVVLLAAGPLVSGWFGLSGVVLLAVACLAYGRVLRSATDAHLELRVVRAAKTLEAFAERHGVAGDALPVAVERIGDWQRIVAIGADGRYGDVLVRDPARAAMVVELVGAEVHDQTDSALFHTVRTGPYEWRRAAGVQLGGSDRS